LHNEKNINLDQNNCLQPLKYRMYNMNSSHLHVHQQ